MELTQVKHEIETLAEKHRDEFETVSACIFAHPELAYHETLAQVQLCGLLEKLGFKVQRGAGSLETAFVAEYRSGKPGMTFAFMCEYDALPEIGHACGHNLIGHQRSRRRCDIKRNHGKIRDRRNPEGSWNTGRGKRKRKDHDAGRRNLRWCGYGADHASE